MTMTEARVAELTNGYERRTDGLWLHRGKADIGTARITQALPPNTGQGLELQHNPGPSGFGFIQAYDRDLAAYRDLWLIGKNVQIATTGGTLNLPAGSVGTSAIAANAVQQLLGSYNAPATFSTTVVSAWVGTPILASFTTAGGLLRLEFSTTLYHSVAGGAAYIAIGWNGVAAYGIGVVTSAFAGPAGVPFSGVYYVTLPAGAHSVQLFVDNLIAGTLSINNAIASTMWVTEQKR